MGHGCGLFPFKSPVNKLLYCTTIHVMVRAHAPQSYLLLHYMYNSLGESGKEVRDIKVDISYLQTSRDRFNEVMLSCGAG